MKIKKALIIAPHQDDETLGCGATIFKLKKNKSKVSCVFIGDPSGYISNKKKLKQKYNEFKKVKMFYKFNNVYEFKLKSSKFHTYGKGLLISKLSKVITTERPDTLFINYSGDVHSDHSYVFECCKPFLKSFRYNYIKNVLMMEIISETDQNFLNSKKNFKPNVFFNVDQFIKKKCKALTIYKSEIGKNPFPRNKENILALAKLRGSQSGSKYAESFMSVKQVIS